jgi:hypothetical protein
MSVCFGQLPPKKLVAGLRKQGQHIELATMFSRLEIAAEMNWSLAVTGTAVLALLSCAFAASLAVVLSIEKRVASGARQSPTSA